MTDIPKLAAGLTKAQRDQLATALAKDKIAAMRQDRQALARLSTTADEGDEG